ncbi:hypothetical protein Tco_1254980 [Tanacetum coccineum]
MGVSTGSLDSIPYFFKDSRAYINWCGRSKDNVIDIDLYQEDVIALSSNEQCGIHTLGVILNYLDPQTHPAG